jgi:hypothetical protein
MQDRETGCCFVLHKGLQGLRFESHGMFSRPYYVRCSARAERSVMRWRLSSSGAMSRRRVISLAKMIAADTRAFSCRLQTLCHRVLSAGTCGHLQKYLHGTA